jgi:hypothetical protein
MLPINIKVSLPLMCTFSYRFLGFPLTFGKNPFGYDVYSFHSLGLDTSLRAFWAWKFYIVMTSTKLSNFQPLNNFMSSFFLFLLFWYSTYECLGLHNDVINIFKILFIYIHCYTLCSSLLMPFCLILWLVHISSWAHAVLCFVLLYLKKYIFNKFCLSIPSLCHFHPTFPWL